MILNSIVFLSLGDTGLLDTRTSREYLNHQGMPGYGKKHTNPKFLWFRRDHHHFFSRIDFPVDEVTVSVDEETGKSVFIDKRELGMSVPGFWGPQTQQVACPPLTGPDLSSRLARPRQCNSEDNQWGKHDFDYHRDAEKHSEHVPSNANTAHLYRLGNQWEGSFGNPRINRVTCDQDVMLLQHSAAALISM